jgi:hypothetical protein
MHHEQNPLFLLAPAAFLYLRIEVIVPSLSTLFAYSHGQVLRDHCPLLSANLFYKLDENNVLFRGPWSLTGLSASSEEVIGSSLALKVSSVEVFWVWVHFTIERVHHDSLLWK